MKYAPQFQYFLLSASLVAIASCGHSSTEINGGPGNTLTACSFTVQTLGGVTQDSGRGNPPIVSDLDLDSSASFTYKIQPQTETDMSKLMSDLCDAGFHVKEAIYVTAYMCKDAIGPRPVVVLANSDARIRSFQEGFTSGASGRLQCAASELRYTPR